MRLSCLSFGVLSFWMACAIGALGPAQLAHAQRFDAVPISGASEGAFFWTLDNYGAVAGWEQTSATAGIAVYALSGAPVVRADFPGRGSSAILSLSNRGYGVGRAQFMEGPAESTPSHAALFLVEGALDLGALDGDALSQASDANDLGTIVGASRPMYGAARSRAFIWEGGVMRALPTPARVVTSEAVTVNNTGLVGGYADGSAYLWIQGRYGLDLGGYLPPPRAGFRRELCYVQDINDAWQIAVQCTDSRGEGAWRTAKEVAFFGSAGVFTEIAPGHDEAHVDAINASGCAVGETKDRAPDFTSTSAYRPFLQCGTAVMSLYEIMTPQGRVVSVSDINDRGEILAVSEGGAPYVLRPSR